MKKTHIIRLSATLIAAIALSGVMSSCASMWFGTDTDLNFTQPGGFGLDIGLSGPIGGPATPPPPPPNPGPGPFGPGGPGPGGPPPGGPGWGPF